MTSRNRIVIVCSATPISTFLQIIFFQVVRLRRFVRAKRPSERFGVIGMRESFKMHPTDRNIAVVEGKCRCIGTSVTSVPGFQGRVHERPNTVRAFISTSSTNQFSPFPFWFPLTPPRRCFKTSICIPCSAFLTSTFALMISASVLALSPCIFS